ncbi:MAG TPA: T9SS type A sorting domain-containing protein [Candidatus Kapabacteria bacterium]|nr:T9SS type A sorting domain-containing protein [Candidatus Kapabacteria bacterium]HPO62972.1 T9SS type A sorting domain-containing protein [Candidatus Kapabacteria bacterium]
MKRIYIIAIILFYSINAYAQYNGGDGDGYSSAVNESIYREFAAPLLIIPSNESTILTINPLLQWHVAAFASFYNLQVSDESEFLTTIFDINGIVEASYVINNLKPETEYFWRVRALDTFDISHWSEVWSFTTFSNKVSLVFPANNSIKQPLNIRFTWQPLNNALKYNFQLAKDNAFIDKIYENAELTSEFVDYVLEKNTKYYWRVRAALGSEVTEWSDVWTFTTFENEIIKPTLISPANHSVELPNVLEFEWSSQSNVFYKLEVALDMDFLFKDVDTTLQYNKTTKKLAENSHYYWRVRATDGVNTSPWSDVWNFYTKYNSEVQEFLVLNQNIDIYPNPATENINLTCIISNPTVLEICICDLLGNKLIKKNEQIFEAGEYKTQINLNSLPVGCYNLLIKTEYGIITKSFLKI